MYIQTNPLGGGGKAFQGSDFFTAPNPPFGATFTYYMKETLKTKKSISGRRRTNALSRQGKDVPYPSWEELKAEDREEAPTAFLTIRDSDGEIVRHIPVPPTQGLHRATWDMRYTGYHAAAAERTGLRTAGHAGHLHRQPVHARRRQGDRAGRTDRVRSRTARLLDDE